MKYYSVVRNPLLVEFQRNISPSNIASIVNKLALDVEIAFPIVNDKYQIPWAKLCRPTAFVSSVG